MPSSFSWTFQPLHVLIYDAHRLAGIGAALAKRHPRQETSLHFTRRNHERVLAEMDRFAEIGVSVVSLDGIAPILNVVKFAWNERAVVITRAHDAGSS